MNEVDLDKSLVDLKRFIISEIKNKNSGWNNYTNEYDSYQRFESNYFSLYKKRPDRTSDGSFIKLNTDSDRIYIKSFGLSEWRLSILIYFYIRRYCKHYDKIKKQNEIKYKWDNFLKTNKVLNRDRKIDDILK
jgi:hypothetical protein